MVNKRKTSLQKKQPAARNKEASFWKITAIVAIVLLFGLSVKMLSSKSSNTASVTAIQPTAIQPLQPSNDTMSLTTNPVEDKVRLVAVNFKCACGGCGELPLAECQCDMPRGAVEEKSFIRAKLSEGLSVPEVIELVDKRYGHKAT